MASFEQLFPFAKYVALNVSSPNTQGLRDLQARDSLSAILRALMERSADLSRMWGQPPKPLLVKIAPDLDGDQLDAILDLCVELKLDGIIVANTTTSRNGLVTPEQEVLAVGDGGLSGAPLTLRARDLVATVYRKTKGNLTIIGVGGIMTGEDAWQMIRAGASLVQVHTGFIYGGPSFIAEINLHLLRRLSESGKASIEEVVGEASQNAGPEGSRMSTNPSRLVSGPA